MKTTSAFLVGSFFLFSACGEEAPAPAEAPDAAEEAQPAAAEELPTQIDAAALEDNAKNITLVPSPLETQRVLQEAGIEANLAENMSERVIDPAETDIERVAVGTGVVIADMLLTVSTSTDEQLLGQLEQIKNGMTALKGGSDITATIDDISERIKAGAINRENLLKELDELSGAIIPELEFEGQKRVVPLIQAGSWLEGAYLVASASKSADKIGASDQILKQPDVVGYFQEYTQKQSEADAGSAYAVLADTLEKLHALASKEEALVVEDIDQVISLTNSVLTLL